MEIKRLTPIVKVTQDCNLGCVYCYTHPDADRQTKMNYETLENIIVKVAEHNKEFNRTRIIWHGGEPLLVGLDFYKKAIEIQNKIDNHRFRNEMQTNGTLLSNEFLDFFEENQFNIGFSLDGIEETHNINRLYKNGKSSFEKTLRMINEVKRRKIGGGVICVLNKITLERINEIYDFMKSNEIHCQFNVQLPSGRARERLDLGITPTEYGKAMAGLFDLWFYDSRKPLIDINPLSDIVYSLGTRRNKRIIPEFPIECIFRNKCAFYFIAFNPSGDVYPCGRSTGDPKLLLGNIKKDSLEKIFQSEIKQIFLRRSLDGIESCKSCEYYNICNSGCPEFSYAFEADYLKKDPFCAGYKIMFRHIERAIKKELEVQ